MKGLCFNCRIDVMNDGENQFHHRLPAIKALFNADAYDLLCLQEVNPRMREALLRQNPEYIATGESRDHNGEQTPILYHKDRMELIKSETLWLTPTPKEPSTIEGSHFPRIATIALVRSKQDQSVFTVINTHLDYANEFVQAQQMTHLLSELNKSDYPLPYLLMGDFNASLNASVHTILKTTEIDHHFFKSVYRDTNPQKTFHGFHGGIEGEPIDYIYTTLPINRVHYRIIREPFLNKFVSDHYPIAFEIIKE